MRHIAQLVRRTADSAAHHLLLGGHVEHFVARLQPAASGFDVTHHHVLRTQRFPVAIDDLAATGRHADHVLPWNRLEDAGIAHVITDDLRHVLWKHGTALPAERDDGNGDGAIGAAGNDDVFLLRHCNACQAAEQDK